MECHLKLFINFDVAAGKETSVTVWMMNTIYTAYKKRVSTLTLKFKQEAMIYLEAAQDSLHDIFHRVDPYSH